MGMIINPYRFAAAGGGSITLGKDDSFYTEGNHGLDNLFCGSTYQATSSGTINYLSIKNDTTPTTENFRLVIYASSNSTTGWGAKLGETAIENGLTSLQVKKLALVSPVNIVAGNYYALGIHMAVRMDFGVDNATTGRNSWLFSDTFADGSADPAGSPSSLGAFNVLVWGTTT